jgi:hypothetical protein
MGSYDGAVQQDMLHIRVIGKMVMHLFPYSVVAPTGKALVDAVPVTVFFGKQSPLGPAAQDPQDGFDEQPAFSFLASIGPGVVL